MSEKLRKIKIFQPKEAENWSKDQYQSIPIKEFKIEVESFYDNMATVLEGLQSKKNNGFILEEITINAEVGAKGAVGFLGTGVEGSAKAGISFKLKRQAE
jgi:hypothetical protein